MSHVAQAPTAATAAGSAGNGTGGSAPPPVRTEVPAWRLVATLAGAGGLAGLLIVSVFQWAQPRVLAHQARVTAGAVSEVLNGPVRTETLFIFDGRLTAAPPAGVDTTKLDRIWAGYDAQDARIGYAIVGAEPGFQDVIRLMFGYDPTSGRVLGMRVLESKETPGLGDKIEKDSAFVRGFRGALAPLVAVKPGSGGTDEREVDTITGATISARAIIGIINRRIEQMQPLLGARGSP